MISNLCANFFVVIFLVATTDSVFYRSPALQEITLKPVAGDFSIRDDQGQRIDITAMSDEQGLLYWYRRIETAVCLTGECKLVDVGLYWDLTGDFFGIEVYGEHLTKTDHSVFSGEDYEKLMEALNNDWSILREYDFEELTTGPVETKEQGAERVDATSGATLREIASEAVGGAVYTTYTLWHLVHNGEKEQLAGLTTHELSRNSLIDHILASGNDKYVLFLLDLFSQAKIQQADKLKPLVMRGLRENSDVRLQELALKSLGLLDINAPDVQESIAEAYTAAPAGLRLRMLTSLKGLQKVSKALYAALEEDVHLENEWFSARVLDLLRFSPSQSPAVTERARELLESKNDYVRTVAEAFFR